MIPAIETAAARLTDFALAGLSTAAGLVETAAQIPVLAAQTQSTQARAVTHTKGKRAAQKMRISAVRTALQSDTVMPSAFQTIAWIGVWLVPLTIRIGIALLTGRSRIVYKVYRDRLLKMRVFDLGGEVELLSIGGKFERASDFAVALSLLDSN
jgi:hypothetical protein